MKKSHFDLSIIVPALNEADIIKNTLDQINDLLRNEFANHQTEVIVVAASDRDNTADVANTFSKSIKNLKVINPSIKVGKGRDVALGFGAASGKVQIFTDADLAIPISNIKPMFNELMDAIEKNEQLALFGSRTKKHANTIRKFLSFASSLTTRILFASSLHDMQCGFKGFTAQAAAVAFNNLETDGWAFDAEVYMRLKKAGIKIKPFMINQWSSDAHHLGGQNILKASFGSMIELIKIRFNSFFY